MIVKKYTRNVDIMRAVVVRHFRWQVVEKKMSIKTLIIKSKAFLALFVIALGFVELALLAISERTVYFEPPPWEPNTVLEASAILSSDENLFFSEPLLSDRDEKPLLAFLVFSAPEHAFQRHEIRRSWGKKAHRLGFPVVFFIGTLIKFQFAGA